MPAVGAEDSSSVCENYAQQLRELGLFGRAFHSHFSTPSEISSVRGDCQLPGYGRQDTAATKKGRLKLSGVQSRST